MRELPSVEAEARIWQYRHSVKKRALVAIHVVDFFTPEAIAMQARYFAQIEAAETTGGCFFAAAGDEARLDMIERQRLQEDGEPENYS